MVVKNDPPGLGPGNGIGIKNSAHGIFFVGSDDGWSIEEGNSKNDCFINGKYCPEEI